MCYESHVSFASSWRFAGNMHNHKCYCVVHSKEGTFQLINIINKVIELVQILIH